MKLAFFAILAGGCVWHSTVSFAQESDPFAESQLEQIATTSTAAPAGASGLIVSGFVDAGYVHITQSGATKTNNSNLSWAYGNSQFNFSNEASTYTVNEVDLTLSAERDLGGSFIGALASLDYYPSRDNEIYQGGTSDRPYQIDQAYVFALISPELGFRVRLGRAPGVVTLEQQTENEAPDSRLIGHTYVYQAAGGYPYGLQIQVKPLGGLTLHFGHSNGGLGDYSFVATDRSTSNKWVANDKGDNTESPETDKVDGKTVYGVADYVVFDRASDIGRLQLGAAYGNNPALTYNAADKKDEPYTFTNVYGAYRVSDYEARVEVATLEAYYQDSIGSFEAGIYSLLLSAEVGANHLLTLRYEQLDYVVGTDGEEGSAVKYGLTYRFRIADPMALKLEYVTETQSPQFYTLEDDLTTTVMALSWIYSF